jgi:NADH-quinone oxidoreductase subunit L
MLSSLIPYFVLIPFIGAALCFFADNKQERLIFGIAIGTISAHSLSALLFALAWVANGCPSLFNKGIELYSESSSAFPLSFYFDRLTVVYGTVSSAITFLVAIFSRYYMHRERGFRRFFNNLLFFYAGINLIILAGNFETLFIGWELIGVTSFFLIAFYRNRYLPVKNALKVFSIYRLADILLLLAIWISHHTFHESITFAMLHEWQMSNDPQIASLVAEIPFILPLLFWAVALIKSAQFPFSSWLPRAIEGPTTSSAVFYGSLSVHIGVFLLLRSYPLWAGLFAFKVMVVVFGLLTAFIATTIARVQSSVKIQIAYSSIAQIGLMFVEVALGWHSLALLHFAGNAFLRTYQLLVSPSVLSYLIHDQFFNFIAPQAANTNSWTAKMKLTFYMLSLKEWNLDKMMYSYLWQPFKFLGRIGGNGSPILFAIAAVVYLTGLYLVYNTALVPPYLLHYFSEFFALLAMLLALKSFSERQSAAFALASLVLSQLFTSLSIGFNEHIDFMQIHIYLSGIVIAVVIAFGCIWQLEKAGESTTLDTFHGHSYERPRLAFLFLLACLGLSGFPITPTFIGEDLIMMHIHTQQLPLIFLTAICLVFDGLAVFRIYSRLFLGPHSKHYHEVAYRSS